MLAQLRATVRAVLAMRQVRIAIGMTAVTSGLALLAQINEELGEQRDALTYAIRNCAGELDTLREQLAEAVPLKVPYPAPADVDPLRAGEPDPAA